jgi:hypothetical protein
MISLTYCARLESSRGHALEAGTVEGQTITFVSPSILSTENCKGSGFDPLPPLLGFFACLEKGLLKSHFCSVMGKYIRAVISAIDDMVPRTNVLQTNFSCHDSP